MKAIWSVSQYLQFENQRKQPIIDLLNRIRDFTPKSAIDLGCGPGNSTICVQQTFPDAQVIGIDNSDDMISRAKSEYANITFLKMDVHDISGTYDLIFSNACLQWIPDHKNLIPGLIANLNEGGVFAAQFPMNNNEPLYQIISDVIEDEKWGFKNVQIDYNGALTPNEYFDLLSSCCSSFQIWETKYYHNLTDHRALIEWVKGTKIRPYLSCLNQEQQVRFENEILERAKKAYPIMQNGEVIFCFNRFFIIGLK